MKKAIRSLVTMFCILTVMLLLTGPVYADLGDTTLKKGMRHPDVVMLQEKLSILNHFDGDEYTDYFGSETETALKAFQSAVGIKPDGVAGKATFKLLTMKIKQFEMRPDNFIPLKEGDSGERVQDFQTKLEALKLYSGPINGHYDAATKEAVAAFQKNAALEPTGIIDFAAMMKLNEEAGKVIADRASAGRRAINAKVVDFAKNFLGAPYVWGASNGKAFDCSGFVMYILKKFNVNLDHSASGQFKKGEKIEKADLQPGDLVFFTTYKKGASHVGIYIGNSKFIHASSGVDQVTITDLNTNYYKRRYLGARRYDLAESN